MPDFAINVSNFARQFEKTLDDVKRKQLPFALSTAINAVAKKIKTGELENFKKVFDKPTPFTLSSIGIKPALKSDPVAVIFVKDIQATYLAPYEFGGKQVPHKVAMITPKNIKLNQYGNIPYGALKLLKAQSGLAAAVALAKNLTPSSGAQEVANAQAALDRLRKGAGGFFIGKVKTKGGWVSGLWQRPMAGSLTPGGRRRKATPQNSHLKLIVRFTDPQTVKQHLNYMLRARIVVGKEMYKELDAAMSKAMLTRKP